MTAGPVDDEERRARVVVSQVAEPGDPDACRLVREFSAAALVDRLRRGQLPHRKAADWAERAAVVQPVELLDRAAACDARFLCPGDPGWPDQLTDLERLEDGRAERTAGSPFGLWVRGSHELGIVSARSVAIVGARAATGYGEHVAGDLAGRCSRQGVATVSGGAYGIDAAAHRGAITCGGHTVVVLAGGIDRLYPSGNTRLLEEAAAAGVMVAEAAPGCAPSKSRFLVRNRLIAALSLGTVVVEAALRSGSLNTARWARELGREVMGVPGPVTSRMSEGVHELLRQPETVLVTDADEVLEQVSPIGACLSPRKEGLVLVRDGLEERSRQVLDAVPAYTPAPAASVALTAGISTSETGERLAALARLGLVERSPVGWRLTDADPPDGWDGDLS